MATLPLYFDHQFLTNAGAPAASHLLYTYESGTTTPKATYTDAGGLTANANPVALDSAGRASVWLGSGSYSFELKTPAGVLVKRWDGVSTPDALTTLAADSGSGLIGYDAQDTYPVGTVGYKLNGLGLSITDFKKALDGSTRTDVEAFEAAIAYAHTLVGTPAYNDRGVSILFPPGIWDLQGITTVNITKSGIGLMGIGAPRSAVIRCDSSLLNIGDYTNAVRVRGVTIKDLTFFNTDYANTDTFCKLYRTAGTRFENCQFINWYLDVDSVASTTTSFMACNSDRPNRTVAGLAVLKAEGVDLTLSGVTYSPGGGIHITDCEWNGASSTVDTQYCYYIKSVDGFYCENTHSSGYVETYAFYPEGTAANRVIASVRSVNCYIDEPSTFAAAPACVVIRGTVRENITAADGLTYRSIYRGIQFVGGEFRGANEALYGVYIRVIDGDSWWDYGINRLEDISFSAGLIIRQMRKRAIEVVGAVSGSNVEPYTLSIHGCLITDNNSDGDAGASDINVECENVSIIGNSIGPAAATGSDYVILCRSADDGATDSAAPTAIISNNDLSRATVGVAFEHIRVTNVNGAYVISSDNLLPTIGKRIEQDYPFTTTSATPVTWTHLIQQNTAGYIEVEVVGNDSTGARYVVYTWSASFKRDSGTAAVDAITAGKAYKDATTPAPTFALSTNTLTLTLNGVAATTINYTVRINMRLAR